jgi:hypothetical protein
MWRVIRIDRSRAMRRLGRRGLLLLLSGAAWLLIGIETVRRPFPRFTADPPSNELLRVFSDPHWGWVWVISGTVAFAMGVLRTHATVRRHDSIGFNAILTPPFLWLLFYLWSFVVGLVTHGRQGRTESLYGVIVWFLVSLFIIVVAGWPEPTESLQRDRPDCEDP